MAVNIPTELLRSFVAIIETGSMLQATERVFVTQSALSLQMRRLEDIVRQPLFNREGRRLRITPAGETLLVTARQILDMKRSRGRPGSASTRISRKFSSPACCVISPPPTQRCKCRCASAAAQNCWS